MSDVHENANEILSLSVSSFASSFPYFAFVVGKIAPTAEDGGSFCFTDGKRIIFGEKQLIYQAATKGADIISLGLCHTLLHDMFLHPFKAKGKDEKIYDAACDITVSYYTDMLGIAFGDRRRLDYRKRGYKSINKNILIMTAIL